MKAIELMPGDIVQHHGEILKLYEFSRKYAYFGEGHPLNGILLDEVEPVPLTPEILEKNGFSTYGEAYYLPNDKKNGDVTVSVGFYMYCTIINIKKGNIQFFKEVPCEYRSSSRNIYIHELQHALRLCGIDKNIEI